jgi:glutamyl-tRNA synthetase
MTIRTRMAPSPTGWLHVGTARTALFNYLFSRKKQGVFVLRIEDTDTERSRKEFEEDITAHLAWLGLSWDEFYRQSERKATHAKYLRQLLAEHKAFYCAHTKEELEKEYREYVNNKKFPRHICAHRNENREKGIIRFRNDTTGIVSFSDIIRREVTFDAALLGDFSLARSISNPLYNFVVVVDDYEMRISHIIRGEDHIPNTPKQLLIQRSLGFPEPRYAHLPLLLGADRSKLSKRHGATSIYDYQRKGYLQEALVNFLALLGWNPGDEREIFSLQELEQEFTLEKVQKSGAIFNEEKLRWMNKEHIKRLPINVLAERLAEFSADATEQIAAIEKERLTTLADISENMPIFTDEPAFKKELLQWKGKQDYAEIIEHLVQLKNILCDMPETDFLALSSLEKHIIPYAERHGKGNVLWPLRAALSGRTASPGPFEIMYAIGKEKTLKRITNALEMVKHIP